MCSVTGFLCCESCPQNRVCTGHKVKSRRCINKDCGKRFVPKCGSQIFCSDECRIDAGFDDNSLLNVIQKYLAAQKERRKEQVKRAKKDYYSTEKGRLAKAAENKRYNERKRERRKQAKLAAAAAAAESAS